MQPKLPNYYELLGISLNASTREIQRAMSKHAQAQTLELEILAQCKIHLLNEEKRAAYHQRLLQTYPNLAEEDDDDENFEHTKKSTKKTKNIIPNWIRYIYGTLVFVLILIGKNYPQQRYYIYIIIVLLLIGFIFLSKKTTNRKNISYQDVSIVYAITTGKVIGSILAINLFFALASKEIQLFKTNTHSESGASYACKEAVKAMMKAPTQTTVSFDKFKVEGSTYTFFGTVDAPNSFGVMLKKSVVCTATHQSSTHYGTSVSLSE